MSLPFAGLSSGWGPGLVATPGFAAAIVAFVRRGAAVKRRGSRSPRLFTPFALVSLPCSPRLSKIGSACAPG